MKALLTKGLDLFLGGAVGPIQAGDDLSYLDRLGSPPIYSFSTCQELSTALKEKGYTHINSFLALPSRRTPRWLLPLGNASGMISGMQVYLPHRRVPRAIKRLLIEMIKKGWNGALASQVFIASKAPLPIEVLVGGAIEEYQPLFALSFGRGPAVRKLTIQVMRPDGEIRGYIKLPLTSAATDRVRHEAMVLDRLWGFTELRPHIPRPLHAGIWTEGYVLFQSSLSGEVGPTKLTTVHETFLRTLWEVHRIQRPGYNLVEEIGAKWQQAAVLLDSKWKDLGREVLRRSAQELDRITVRCGISHGDFAPWNTRVNEGRLLLFDWESTHWEAPTSWDLYHFCLQTTATSLNKSAWSELQIRDHDGALYLLYLLNSVIQFLQEENRSAINNRRRLLVGQLEKHINVRVDDRAAPKHIESSVQEGGRSNAALPPAGDSATPRIVTTSWDDGDPLDLRIAELLRSRGLRGTLYIPISGYLSKETLRPADLRALSSAGFEIGAHSVSHKSLTLFPESELEREVTVCKQVLEQMIGTEVSMFCYPNGRYSPRVIRELKYAGYKGARTTQMLAIKSAFLPFEMPTTVQAYPHPKAGYLRDLGRAKNVSGLWRFTTELSQFETWLELAKRLFSQVLGRGGIWHLYGHSWEIEAGGIWDDLREILDHVSNREGVTYMTNGQLLSSAIEGQLVSSMDV